MSKPADSGRVSKTMADDACTAYRLLMDHEEGPCEPAMVAAIEAALAAQGQMEEFARVAVSAACPACGSYGPCVDSVACGATAVTIPATPAGVPDGMVETVEYADLPPGYRMASRDGEYWPLFCDSYCTSSAFPTRELASLAAWKQAHEKLDSSMRSIRRLAAPSSPEGDGGAE